MSDRKSSVFDAVEIGRLDGGEAVVDALERRVAELVGLGEIGRGVVVGGLEVGGDWLDEVLVKGVDGADRLGTEAVVGVEIEEVMDKRVGGEMLDNDSC